MTETSWLTIQLDRLTDVHYGEIRKSELRRSDRREAMCVENIFSKLRNYKCKFFCGSYRNNRAITAGQLKRPEAKDNMAHHNEGFKPRKS